MNTIDAVWSGVYAKSFSHAKALAQTGANRTYSQWSVIRDEQGRFYVTNLVSSWSLFTATPGLDEQGYDLVLGATRRSLGK